MNIQWQEPVRDVYCVCGWFISRPTLKAANLAIDEHLKEASANQDHVFDIQDKDEGGC